MIIAILGPDGSGKTTVANAVVAELNNNGFVARHFPCNFGILPQLSAFGLARKSERVLDESGYDLRANSALRSLVYMNWYGLDYLLGGIALRLNGWPGTQRHAAVFARYFYDYYYQSNNRKLPDAIKRVIELMVPRPDYTFFLDRDAADIHASKPELPIGEIERQQTVIRTRLARLRGFHTINARNGAESTVGAILGIIRRDSRRT